MSDFVTPGGLTVDPAALDWVATRPGGPGGQHANTSDTAVTVSLDVAASGLPDAVRDRITAVLGPVVVSRSADTRSQWRNRQLAWRRLAALLDSAARPAPVRRRTTPTTASKERRLDDKRRRSALKRARRTDWDDQG